MDFRSLQYFVAVAEELNFTRAAERLDMSQPPLSNQIKQLEEELDTQLFIRGKRHLTLTESGRLLLRRSREILEMADKARGEILSLGGELSGTIAIGMVDGRAPYIGARLVRDFGQEFPLVRYNFWNGSSDDVIDRIFRGLLDVGIIAAPYDAEHLDGITVGSELWCAMLPETHPLAQKEEDRLSLKMLGGERIFIPQRSSRQEAVLRWFQEVGAEPDIVGTLSNFETAAAIAAMGAGISIFPHTSADAFPHIVTKVLTDPEKRAEYVLVWNNETKPRELVEEFINFVQDAIETPGQMEESITKFDAHTALL